LSYLTHSHLLEQVQQQLPVMAEQYEAVDKAAALYKSLLNETVFDFEIDGDDGDGFIRIQVIDRSVGKMITYRLHFVEADGLWDEISSYESCDGSKCGNQSREAWCRGCSGDLEDTGTALILFQMGELENGVTVSSLDDYLVEDPIVESEEELSEEQRETALEIMRKTLAANLLQIRRYKEQIEELLKENIELTEAIDEPS
jgi:hypothetical protein